MDLKEYKIGEHTYLFLPDDVPEGAELVKPAKQAKAPKNKQAQAPANKAAAQDDAAAADDADDAAAADDADEAAEDTTEG